MVYFKGKFCSYNFENSFLKYIIIYKDMSLWLPLWFVPMDGEDTMIFKEEDIDMKLLFMKKILSDNRI
jgi:hypothetical protein